MVDTSSSVTQPPMSKIIHLFNVLENLQKEQNGKKGKSQNRFYKCSINKSSFKPNVVLVIKVKRMFFSIKKCCVPNEHFFLHGMMSFIS